MPSPQHKESIFKKFKWLTKLASRGQNVNRRAVIVYAMPVAGIIITELTVTHSVAYTPSHGRRKGPVKKMAPCLPERKPAL